MESIYTPYLTILVGMFVFLVLVSSGVCWVAALRRAEIERNNQYWLTTNPRLTNAEIKRHLVLLASPLDQLIPYYMPEPDDALNHFSRLLEQVPGPLIRPMRLQDTLLFADTLNTTAEIMPRAS
jgi:hypothetical protein